jgi:hypothetical protein
LKSSEVAGLKEYDFTQVRKNACAAQLKKRINIWLDENSIGYFK